MSEQTERSHFSLWMQAVRPFSFSASITPVLIGTALAYYEVGKFNFLFLICALVGGVLLHCGTNLVSEYFDLKAGADKPDTFGSSKVLVDKLLEPKAVLRGGLYCFAGSFLIGIFLTLNFGWMIVALGSIGLLGGFFYTAGPFGYKYRALGEPFVATLMGVLMVLGSYYVQVSQLSWLPIWVSIPISLLVAAILTANNLRDIPHDTRAGFSTIANKMGWEATVILLKLTLLGAYVSLIILVVTNKTPLFSLLALISLIPMFKIFKTIGAARPNTPKDLAMLDVSTAQLHMAFGLLFTIGFVINSFI